VCVTFNVFVLEISVVRMIMVCCVYLCVRAQPLWFSGDVVVVCFSVFRHLWIVGANMLVT
jgi:hypothetical protein